MKSYFYFTIVCPKAGEYEYWHGIQYKLRQPDTVQVETVTFHNHVTQAFTFPGQHQHIRHVGLARTHHVLTVTETMGQREAPSPQAPSSLMLETTRGKMPAGSVTQSCHKITDKWNQISPDLSGGNFSVPLIHTNLGGEILMWAYSQSLKGNANGLQDMHFSVCPCCITVNLELNLLMLK